ncbi:MAG: hypothetical protein ACD_79C01458G0002 [uncultured bacterium]|nr:MAG: hypothetical protein ACD_79C01458G0002 [uncultured bacterium]
MENENIIPIAIEDSMKKAFIDYSMSVIIGRALPDVRDGLKPVHRRILYAMNEMALYHNRPFKKSARVVGEVLGKYHPHGDTSVYDAMVRMTQDFSLRYPLIRGQGNFGSVDGDPPAAMRYTEAKMAALSSEMLEDIDKNTVGWRTNFDESLMEPEVLPSKIPNLLLNGSSGIAVGMATNIPPQNFIELAKGIEMLIDNPMTTVEQLMAVIKGPDFPTGGIICGRRGIYEAYKTGHGSLIIRSRTQVEQAKDGREVIIINEIPYQVNKSVLLKHIAKLVNQKEIAGISDLRDESDKDGMRIVIELKRGEIAQVVINNLFKQTNLQTSFSCNMLSIIDGRPKVLNLKEMLEAWILHRVNVITKATQFDLEKAEKRAHILEGFKIALLNIDGIINIIKKSNDREKARTELQLSFNLSEVQANAILDMRLYQITALEADKIEKEYQELQEKIKYYKSLLEDPSKIYAIIKTDTNELAAKYGDVRRSTIEDEETDLVMEDLIADESCIITLSHAGYIKRVPANTYKAQKRGGRGVTGMITREEDYVEHVYSAMTHDTMLIFTSTGMLHWLRVFHIPEASRVAKGVSIANLLNISNEEKIASMITVREFTEDKTIVMATKKGVIKKSNLSLFSNIRKKGIIAINIKEEDALIQAAISSGKDDILLSTSKGLSIRFNEERVSEMGRSATGVRGVKLKTDDSVISMEIVKSEILNLLIVCENGFGKRSPFEEFRITNRGGKGVISIKTTERNGDVVTALAVKDDDDIMVITSSGMMVRINVKGISIQGRNTQGVKIVNLKPNDKIVSITTIEKDDSEEALESQEKTDEPQA